MSPAEIQRMAAVEGEHWWYCGLRDIIRRTLEMPRFMLAPRARVLDAGCGTGENLRLLQELLQPTYLGGFDLSPLAVRLTRAKVPEADVYQGDLRDPHVHADNFDLILSCDAISVAGIAACQSGLTRLVRHLRHEGLLILHLPAYRWLYSAHDVAIETRDRTTAGEVRALFEAIGVSVEMITYRLCSLFPAIVLARLPTMLQPRFRQRAVRSDVAMPSRLSNAVLRGVMTAENWAIARRARLPWGSSVYAVGRKL